MPMIAFITTYDEYAVRAFELNAVDYLLKPVDAARLRETVSRAIDRLDRDDARATAVKNVRSAASAFEVASACAMATTASRLDAINPRHSPMRSC